METAIIRKPPIQESESSEACFAAEPRNCVRKQASFRLRADLLERLRRNAASENRTLNNYVESVLLDIVYREPNAETRAAIEEAMTRKHYPERELHHSVDDLFKALDEE